MRVQETLISGVLLSSQILNRRRSCSLLAEGGLISVGDVEETIGVLLAIVDLTHEGVALEHVLALHEEVERVLLWHLDSLADNIGELVSSQVVGHQVPAQKGQGYLTWRR